jgi:threonylcarbamoyladenosine tRNA methylthiotransferase MtaB
MISLAVHTLGCKLNQLESEALVSAFKSRGFTVLPWGAAADILVVNTCTVTSKAEQKARRVIRTALRECPGSCVIVTGCYAQLDSPGLEALGREAFSSPRGRLFVAPGDIKALLLDLPDFLRREGAFDRGDIPALLGRWEKARPLSQPDDRFRFNGQDFSFHSRPFLKIQDGCSRACSYCRVPLARGASVSLEAGVVLARLRALEDRGFGEAVLTGVNISGYRDGEIPLAGLLAGLLRGTRAIALRLSSLEPEAVGPELLDVLGDERIRPHFHLSLQSGSPRILERMHRPYSPGDAECLAGRLRALKGDPFLACDMIAGFPGETAADFEQSYELCRRIDFAWIHPFPYSPRPGTEAAAFKEAVPQRDAAVRVNALSVLARQGRAAYVSRWLGKGVDAVAEGGKKPGAAYGAALSGNYLRLLVPCSASGDLPPPGIPLRCRLEGLPKPLGRFDALARLEPSPSCPSATSSPSQ